MKMTTQVRPVKVFQAWNGEEVEKFGVYVRPSGEREIFASSFPTEAEARDVARQFGPIDDESPSAQEA
jgi:hypothetical protein